MSPKLAAIMSPAAIEFDTASQVRDIRGKKANGRAPRPVTAAVTSANTKTVTGVMVIAAALGSGIPAR
jgi:hypothetical protein